MLKNFILFFLAFISMHANAICPCWKNLYLCPCTKNISKLLFIKNTMYAFSANEGLLKSDDEGKTWTAMRTGLHWQALNIVGLVGEEENHFILATGGVPQFYEWHSDISSWIKIKTTGIPSNGILTNLIQDSKGTLYAVIENDLEGIYQSTDHGIHWANLKLKNALAESNHQQIKLYHLKLLLDSQDNLYVSGKMRLQDEVPQGRKKFLYELSLSRKQWVDTHYAVSDFFISDNNRLGLISDDRSVVIKDIQLKADGQVKEKQSWTFYPPMENINAVMIVDHNNMYMIAESNLYQLININDPQSKWALVKNSDINIPDIACLVVHNHQLYGAGGRLNQSESSIDVFQLMSFDQN